MWVHREIGRRQLDRVVEMLGPIAVVENPPRMEGRFLSMILVPNRDAVTEAKREEDAARAAEETEQAEQAEGTEAVEKKTEAVEEKAEAAAEE